MARWMVKFLAVSPALMVSTLVTCLVGAVLPAPAGLVLFVGGLTTAGLLLLGVGEAPAARILCISRPLRADELADLAGAVTLLCRVGLGPPLIDLRVRRGASIGAGGMGRRTVVISAGLLAAVADGSLPDEQAAAVIAHAAGLTRAGWVRNDAVIGFWSMPWQVLRGIAEGVAAAARRLLPATSVLWRLRGVVVVIAVVQNVQQHQVGLAVLIGCLGALSYAIPVWERRWQQLMVEAGDRLAHTAGFSAPLAEFLRRCPTTAVPRSRIRGLQDAPSRPTRQLGPVTVP